MVKTITINGVEYQLTPVATAPRPIQWEPNRVDISRKYYAMDRLHDIFSIVEEGDSLDALHSNRGNYFHSQQEGLDAATQIRQLLRLRAYVREFAPDYKPDWNDYNEHKWHIYFDNRYQEWAYSSNQFMHLATVVYMPECVAKELAHKLNSGEVVL